MFRTNIGATERAVRILVGVALLALGLLREPAAWWGWFGIVPLVTGMAAYCPLWNALGVSTIRPRPD